MNIDRLTEIADWLDQGAPEKAHVTKFDMANFIEDAGKPNSGCGTACCIAGAAIQFSRAIPFESYSQAMESTDLDEGFVDEAASILDLEIDQAEALFYARNTGDLRSISPAWAARCIRKLIATGEVDWVGTRHA